MQAARDRQKSYADLKRKLMEFPKSGDKRYAYLFRLGKGCTFWQRETLNPGMLELFKVVRKRLERFLLKTRVPEELFVEEPVEIMDREVKRLKQSRILLIKVRWNSKRGHEFMWESNGPNSRRNTTPSSQDRTVVKCCIVAFDDLRAHYLSIYLLFRSLKVIAITGGENEHIPVELGMLRVRTSSRGYDNITMFDDGESSDDDCDKSNLINHHDISPFLATYQACAKYEGIKVPQLRSAMITIAE
ncbi:hypothetical protein Tco_0003184 [Tanacetum coccineum]